MVSAWWEHWPLMSEKVFGKYYRVAFCQASTFPFSSSLYLIVSIKHQNNVWNMLKGTMSLKSFLSHIVPVFSILTLNKKMAAGIALYIAIVQEFRKLTRWNPFDLFVFPANIYLLKVNNKNIRKMYERCSNLAIKTPKRVTATGLEPTTTWIINEHTTI